MNQRSTFKAVLATLVLPIWLSACATTDTTPAAAQAKSEDRDEAEVITGSRIPRVSTERLLRRTDNTGAREMERDRPPTVGPLNK